MEKKQLRVGNLFSSVHSLPVRTPRLPPLRFRLGWTVAVLSEVAAGQSLTFSRPRRVRRTRRPSEHIVEYANQAATKDYGAVALASGGFGSGSLTFIFSWTTRGSMR
ncbi:hypothetical protein Mal15_44660 [Stieleria maiorica]|uniref:Uncharacterized protein n=1 Tax=Stieleria maiorica TaxID=2795974 RepID=A0A5B9MLK0_9BACT|nr:hypothetical protein Mal15_44660 [Stieleria maiorica]